MTIFISLCFYGLAMIAIGAMVHSFKDSSEYHTASRKAGTFGVFAGVFTLMGAGEFVTVTALSYDFGIWSVTLFAGLMVGLFVLSFLMKEARAEMSSRDLHSLPDYMYYKFGSQVSIITSFLSLVSLWCLLLIQFVVGGMIIQMLTDLSYVTSVLFMAVIVLAYVWLGGFRSVLITDKIQALFIIGLCAAYLLFFEGGQAISLLPADLKLSAPPFDFTLSFVVFGFFAAVGAADIWQRLLTAKDNKSAANGLRLSGAVLLVFGLAVYLMTLVIKDMHPAVEPSESFMMFLSDMPSDVAVIISLLVFSSILSTADTELFATSVIARKELTRKNEKNMDVRITKIFIAGVTVFTTACALLFDNLVDIYMTLLFVFMVCGSVTLPALLNRGNSNTVLFGLIGGTTVLATLYFTGGLASGYLQMLILAPALPCWFVSYKGKSQIQDIAHVV